MKKENDQSKNAQTPALREDLVSETGDWKQPALHTSSIADKEDY
jgi:hypothetical protein